MSRTAEGSKVFIAQPVIELAERTNPAGVSRTAWINYLIQIGVENAPKHKTDAA